MKPSGSSLVSENMKNACQVRVKINILKTLKKMENEVIKDNQFRVAYLEPTNAERRQLSDFREVVIGTHVVIPFKIKIP